MPFKLIKASNGDAWI